MNLKKLICMITAAVTVLSCFASCSRIASYLPGKAETQKYVNSDYHFSLVCPSYFSEIKEIPSEENGDEYRIELKNGKKSLITVDITYKTASDLYEFAELLGFPKNKIIPLSMDVFPNAVNSFAFDHGDVPSTQTPGYYIFAMTKRMLYTVSFEYERGDAEAKNVIDTLKFDFDIYANVPKENQFMSPLYYFANGYTGFSFPADATLMTYPNPADTPRMTLNEETGEVINPIYLLYKTAEAYSSDSYFAIRLPDAAGVTMTDLAADDFDGRFAGIVSELAGYKISNAKFDEKGSYASENLTNYRKMYFTCLYNGKKASGTVVAGYTGMLKYFENVYVVTDDATEAQQKNYIDMIHSVKL